MGIKFLVALEEEAWRNEQFCLGPSDLATCSRRHHILYDSINFHSACHNIILSYFDVFIVDTVLPYLFYRPGPVTSRDAPCRVVFPPALSASLSVWSRRLTCDSAIYCLANSEDRRHRPPSVGSEPTPTGDSLAGPALCPIAGRLGDWSELAAADRVHHFLPRPPEQLQRLPRPPAVDLHLPLASTRRAQLTHGVVTSFETAAPARP